MSSSNESGHGPRHRFKLLRGGLADLETVNENWEAFCQRIGWQQPTEPELPDDYEEALAARVFKAIHNVDNVVPITIGYELRRIDGESRCSCSRLAIAPLGRLATSDSRRRRGRVALPLKTVAITAIVATAATFVITMLSEANTSETETILPTPVTEAVTPPVVQPPTSVEVADRNETVEQTTHEPKLVETKLPDAGQTRVLVRRQNKPRSIHAIPNTKSKVASTQRTPSSAPAPQVAMGSSTIVASDARALSADPIPTVTPPESVALASLPAPLIPTTTGKDAASIGDVLTTSAPPRDIPLATANLFSHTTSNWYSLGMTAPRERSGVPAGVRIMGQIDVTKAAMSLWEKL